MIKIYQTPSDIERLKFFNGFQLDPSLNVDNLSDIKYLFIHNGDKLGLSKMDKEKLERFDGWKIYYSGGNTGNEEVNEDSKIVTGISWETIKGNFKYFFNKVSNVDSINDIFILIGFDPKLESKLNQFAFVSPYETTNEQGKILKDAKADLQNDIAEYLKKQSNP